MIAVGCTGGTAAASTCCSSTCCCYECSGSSYELEVTTVASSNVYYMPVFDPPESINLFDERYWLPAPPNRFNATNQRHHRIARANRELHTDRWMAKARNSKPQRRKTRTFER